MTNIFRAMGFYAKHRFILEDKSLTERLLNMLNFRFDEMFYIESPGIVTDEKSNFGSGASGVFLWNSIDDIVEELSDNYKKNINMKVTCVDELGEHFGWTVKNSNIWED